MKNTATTKQNNFGKHFDKVKPVLRVYILCNAKLE